MLSMSNIPDRLWKKLVCWLLKLETFMERDYFMSAEEAVEFGLVDGILRKKEPVGLDVKK